MGARDLERLHDLLEVERARPVGDRESRATDDQLDGALRMVTRAREADGAATVEADQLAQLAHWISDGWPFSTFGADVLERVQALRRAAARDRPSGG